MIITKGYNLKKAVWNPPENSRKKHVTECCTLLVTCCPKVLYAYVLSSLNPLHVTTGSSGSSATLKNWSENCFVMKVKDNGQFQPSRCTAARVKLNWMKRRPVIMFCSVLNEFKISHKPWLEGYYFRGSDYFKKQSTKNPAKYSGLIRRIVQKAVSPV